MSDPKNIIEITKDIRWDVEELSINKDGTLLSFCCNEDGASRLYLLQTKTNTFEKYEEILPLGVISSLEFHPEKPNILALDIDAAVSPGDVFTLDTNNPREKGSLTRWTFSEVGGLPSHIFVQPKIIYYETFDKDPNAIHKSPDDTRRIPAFVYQPPKKSDEVLFHNSFLLNFAGLFSC